MPEKKYHILDYLKRSRNKPGDQRRACNDAKRIAAYLRVRYGATVLGIGSLFDDNRSFRQDSDIDLVAQALPSGCYFQILAEIGEMTDFKIDLIPMESAHDYLKNLAKTTGVRL